MQRNFRKRWLFVFSEWKAWLWKDTMKRWAQRRTICSTFYEIRTLVRFMAVPPHWKCHSWKWLEYSLIRVDLVSSTELIMLISQLRVSRLTFRTWGFPQNKWMNFGMCMFVCRRWSCAVGGNIVTRKTRIDKLNEKRSLIPVGLREPIWKMNLCSRLSELPSCKERPKSAICSKERIGRLKCLATCLDASLPFLST